MNLIAKTASPGPGVSVPSPGAPRVAQKKENWNFSIFFSGSEISTFQLKLRFSIESDSKNGFSRSRCIGSEPGTHENLADFQIFQSFGRPNSVGRARNAVERATWGDVNVLIVENC